MTDVDQNGEKVVFIASMAVIDALCKAKYSPLSCLSVCQSVSLSVCLSVYLPTYLSVRPSPSMLVEITNCRKFTLSCSEFKNFISNRFYHLCYRGDLIPFK